MFGTLWVLGKEGWQKRVRISFLGPLVQWTIKCVALAFPLKFSSLPTLPPHWGLIQGPERIMQPVPQASIQSKYGQLRKLVPPGRQGLVINFHQSFSGFKQALCDRGA